MSSPAHMAAIFALPVRTSILLETLDGFHMGVLDQHHNHELVKSKLMQSRDSSVCLTSPRYGVWRYVMLGKSNTLHSLRWHAGTLARWTGPSLQQTCSVATQSTETICKPPSCDDGESTPRTRIVTIDFTRGRLSSGSRRAGLHI